MCAIGTMADLRALRGSSANDIATVLSAARLYPYARALRTLPAYMANANESIVEETLWRDENAIDIALGAAQRYAAMGDDVHAFVLRQYAKSIYKFRGS